VTAESGLTTKGQFWQWELFPSFTHYWQHEPEIFYSDLTLQLLRLRILAIQLLQEAVRNGRTSVEDADPKLVE